MSNPISGILLRAFRYPLLLSEGKIRSICVRSQKGAQRGVRLIDTESIDSFIESHAVV
jgi:hypothetical protein